MAAIDGVELRGRAHDGERYRPSPPSPRTLFAITADDGEQFARTDERLSEGEVVWTLFRFDDEGAEIARARGRFCG